MKPGDKLIKTKDYEDWEKSEKRDDKIKKY